MPPYVIPVGVFVNEPLVKAQRLIKTCGFQVVQLHGDEPSSYCEKLYLPVIKVIRMKDAKTHLKYRNYKVAGFLLDAYHKSARGGTGKGFNPAWAKKAAKDLQVPVLLAGV